MNLSLGGYAWRQEHHHHHHHHHHHQGHESHQSHQNHERSNMIYTYLILISTAFTDFHWLLNCCIFFQKVTRYGSPVTDWMTLRLDSYGTPKTSALGHCWALPWPWEPISHPAAQAGASPPKPQSLIDV